MDGPDLAKIRLVVGLGNPGRKYAHTRHNIGFDILDELASSGRVDFSNQLKFRAHVAKLPGGAALMKPQTFMNASGEAVGKWMRFYQLSPEEILTVYDDTDLDLGVLRFRAKGSAGGHNGIKSLISHLGSDHFPRLKVGVGGAAPGGQVGHVLGTFREEERDLVENTLATAVQAVQLALSQGQAAAANAFNGRIKLEESPPTDEQEIRRTDRPQHQG